MSDHPGVGFLRFYVLVEPSRSRKTYIWSVRSRVTEEEIGRIQWYPGWRRYCLYSIGPSYVFDAACLQEIVDFIKQQMEDHKKKEDPCPQPPAK